MRRNDWEKRQMKLASLMGGKDGRLVVVSRDLARAVSAGSIASTMIEALERWGNCQPRLAGLYEELNSGTAQGDFGFDPKRARAPLPRAPQWCDGSAFLSHVRLMEKAFNISVPCAETPPLMYQGASDDLLGPNDDVALPDEAHGIDFEGEFAVVVGDVPLGCPASLAHNRICLLLQVNDVSLRALAPREMKTGFGFLQSKPSSSFAPVAVTPDEIGDAWRDARVHLDLEVLWNGEWFGSPNGGEMAFGFDQLIEHAAKTRRLSAGTIIGSGTVSNEGGKKGSACIAERRAIEQIGQGAPKTGFMKFGDRVRMETRTSDGRPVFGAIEQRVVQAPVPGE
jgi:fumarylacetoacetate (FAA) hydrolase